MNYNHLIIASLSVAASMGWTWGQPIYAQRSTGCLYHHSGCGPSGRNRPKYRRRNMGISQVTIRKNRRRAHAAGKKHAFA